MVLALRGTMSMADIVTDAVAHPEQIDDWLPPRFARVRASAGLLGCVFVPGPALNLLLVQGNAPQQS